MIKVVVKELAREVMAELPETTAIVHPAGSIIKLVVRHGDLHHIFTIIMGIGWNHWGVAKETSATSGIIKHNFRKRPIDRATTFDLLENDSIDKIKSWITTIVNTGL